MIKDLRIKYLMIQTCLLYGQYGSLRTSEALPFLSIVLQTSIHVGWLFVPL